MRKTTSILLVLFLFCISHGASDELAGGVVFLCSDAASFMTCEELNIDGGYVFT